MSICGIAVENDGKPIAPADLKGMASSLQIGDGLEHNIRTARRVGFAATGATQAECPIADDALLVAFDGDLYTSRNSGRV